MPHRIYFMEDVLNWLRLRRVLSDSFFTVEQIETHLYGTGRAVPVKQIRHFCSNLFDDGKIEKRGSAYRFIKEEEHD